MTKAFSWPGGDAVNRLSPVVCLIPWAAALASEPSATRQDLPGPEEVIASKVDLWGEAALRQPGGPSYEFFADLLPPLRYVDADFRHYPIVLSAPGSTVKGRLVSNGSAINALARMPVWVNEEGTPVFVRVGRDREPFGSDLSRLDGPHFADGFLPIVRLRYTHEGNDYEQEAFAAVDDDLAAAGTVAVRFDFPARDRGRIDLRIERGHEVLSARDGLGSVR